jgi:hypothetical protein
LHNRTDPVGIYRVNTLKSRYSPGPFVGDSFAITESRLNFVGDSFAVTESRLNDAGFW